MHLEYHTYFLYMGIKQSILHVCLNVRSLSVIPIWDIIIILPSDIISLSLTSKLFFFFPSFLGIGDCRLREAVYYQIPD